MEYTERKFLVLIKKHIYDADKPHTTIFGDIDVESEENT